ncbi:response regulator transcription factor [Pseudomonas sp. M5A4_2d]|uniref:LuxR family transcriptional regulator n=1 Tax=Pseudomonas antarctica TaxID=219572 RepID=A0A172Z4H1_9PSED|nr:MULTISPECIES: response regulator transcription factor [Pseudomonas]MBX7277708.1 response regulator transcription factor [Pseudomonas sp. ERGC3:01]OAE13826.1 DNA-binding response regulator [Pseudomonas simiae]QZC96782.1 response regulator transcription factor [Pseudomonas sp. ERGC3:05]ANF87443.1 LuxR family transcriptional regulator [Pseudomonas antarctica]UXV18133.1 response regulator transcription factor [Pseudomonas fluorescens]
MTCTLLLVDDHALIRAGVRALIQDMPGYTVVGEASDGAQLLEKFSTLQPNIVLLDLSMKYTGGLDALQQLKATYPKSKVLILSMHTDPELIMRALESGAHGYLLKDTTANELEHALMALRNNERYLSPAIAHTVINQALIRSQGPIGAVADSHNLTARQLEILRLIVRGKSTREIAQGLGLSIKTVEAHRSQIMKRLQIFDVAGLVLFAVREQIISLDD